MKFALRFLAGIALGVLIIFATSARGSAEEAHPYIEVFGGYQWPGNISAGGEGDPKLKTTLEREGQYSFGAGAGWQFADGINIGGKVRYDRVACDRNCAEFYDEGQLDMATIGILATIGFTLDTGRVVPFMEADAGLGYVSMICKGHDGCPGTEKFPDANLGDVGLMYGVCGGWRTAVAEGFDLIADACWHRVEMVSVTRPHFDAPEAITASMRVRYRL